MRRKLKSLWKLALILRRWSYIRALRFGVAAAVEHERMLTRLGCRTVVDIGANRGQFSLVCRRVASDAAIFAFEPLQSAAEVYRKLFAHDPATKLTVTAIGSAEGPATMHVSKREDSSSLLPIGGLQETVFPETGQSHECPVEVAPLSRYLSPGDISRPALLKIDVQGSEQDVLQGSLPLLALFDHVYVECSFVELYVGQALVTQIVQMLAGHGFHLQGVYNVHYDRGGRAIQADCLFTRR